MDPVSQFEYSPEVLRRFSHPTFAGSLAQQPGAFAAEAGSRRAGASVRLWVLPNDGRAERVQFEAYGCPHFVAAADMLAEWCQGRKFNELDQWNWLTVQNTLQVPQSKRGRLLILENALKRVNEMHISTQRAAG